MKCPQLTILFCMTAAAAAAQSVADGPAFEVASMKVAAPFDALGYRDEGGPGTASPGQWRCANIPLDALIMKAWNLDRFQLSRSSSTDNARYDIVAKVPPGTSRSDVNLMIRRLLMERVSLTVHQESKEQKIREMTIAKGGIKMKPAEQAPSDAPAAAPRLGFDSDGNPQLPPGSPRMVRLATVAGVFIVGRMQGIDDLARTLQASIGQKIIDKTGLTGKYDYTLKLALPATVARSAPNGSAANTAPGAEVPEAGDPGPSLEVAIVEQLGLKLQPAKATVEILVVDRFNRVPTEN
jgi:uncharacterized protein (TIGR03435 family)